tara:strand:- start:7 stop:246 length:240 start_codon:yes stop_codon:yes gene_type:complete
MCKSLAFWAVALIISDSFATNVLVNISADVLAAIDLSFSNENTAAALSVNVKVNVQAFDASSLDTLIDLIIAVVAVGTV